MPKQRETTATGAGTVPDDVRPTTVRLDDSMYADIQAEADRRGLGSASEYIRQAVITQLAWDRALRAVEAGTKPADLDSFGRLAELLAAASKAGRSKR